MDIILLLIPAALMVSGVAIIVFFWSVRSGQFEDLEGDAYRIIMDGDDNDVEPSDDKEPEQTSR